MARTRSDPWSYKVFQDTLDRSLSSTLSLVAFGAGVVDLACSAAFRSDVAKRLDPCGATHDFPGDSVNVLVASSEPHVHYGLWRRLGLLLHHNPAYQRFGCVAHVCATT